MRYVVQIRPDKRMETMLISFRISIGPFMKEMYRNYSHCTLFSGQFDPKDEGELIHSLEHVKSDPIPMFPGQLELFDSNSLVTLVHRSRKLHDLHYRVAEAAIGHVDPRLREPMPEKYADDIERQVARMSCGSINFGQFYTPHITICRLTDPKYFSHVVGYHGDRFKDHSWEATEFWLSKKEEEWEMVKKFNM